MESDERALYALWAYIAWRLGRHWRLSCCTSHCSRAAFRLCPWVQVHGKGEMQDLHCRRIMPGLLAAAELLIRALDCRQEHWQAESCKPVRHALAQVRCAATRDSGAHADLAS